MACSKDTSGWLLLHMELASNHLGYHSTYGLDQIESQRGAKAADALADACTCRIR